MSQDFMTPQEVADRLKVHVATIYEYLRMGKIKAVKLGNRYRISESNLQVFIHENETTQDGRLQKTLREYSEEGREYGQ